MAISAGGDTDSTAAMTGTISGAFLGLSNLPKNFVKIVNDKDGWLSQDLEKLAKDCYEIGNEKKKEKSERSPEVGFDPTTCSLEGYRSSN